MKIKEENLTGRDLEEEAKPFLVLLGLLLYPLSFSSFICFLQTKKLSYKKKKLTVIQIEAQVGKLSSACRPVERFIWVFILLIWIMSNSWALQSHEVRLYLPN